MNYLTIKEIAEKWGVSERSVRNYCESGTLLGAVRENNIWKIPEAAEKPTRKKRAGKISTDLLTRLKQEKEAKIHGGIYHKIQIDLTYNSNHIEGSKLTHDQTRLIFETNTIGVQEEAVNVDDIVETMNHFRCVDMAIDMAAYQLSESFIKQLHLQLKSGTADSRKAWFAVGEYKKVANEVGGIETTPPSQVQRAVKELLSKYNESKAPKTLREIIEFHYEFEKIHPFQDGNGRVGRLILFKECLRNGVTPFIIDDSLKNFYYRGLNEWKNEPGYLMDTCLTAQDRFKKYMEYFGLKFTD